VFSSSHTTPGLSFAVVLRSNTQQQRQPHLLSVAQACLATVREMSVPPPLRHNQQQVPSQSVQVPRANSSSLNDMLKVFPTVFQQTNGAESEEDRVVVITEIVLKLMKQNGR
jgi:hypothetical protein